MNYTHLNVKSHYSILNSLLKVDDVIRLNNSSNFSACAICDINNTFNVFELYFKSGNLKPLLGINLIFNNDEYILYAKNYEGLQNIFRLSTLVNEDKCDFNTLLKYSSNLVCIVNENSKVYINYLNDLFDIEIYNLLLKEFGSLYFMGNDEVFSNKYSFKMLPNIEVKYNEKSDKKYFDVLKCIENNHQYIRNTEVSTNYFYSGEEIVNRFSNEVLSNVEEIINMCNVIIPNEILIPKFDEKQDSFTLLFSLCKKGLERRVENYSNEYIDRLKYELEVIKSMNFSDYFLIVFDYVRFAKSKGIYVGVGRGSAAGSLVAYVLGITGIDPIKYGLLFERFLNPKRITFPDIDLDFEDTRRDEIIEYLVNKYGMDYVGVIATFSTFASKQVLRDTAKVFGKNNSQIKELIKEVSPLVSLDFNYKNSKSFAKRIDSDPDNTRIFAYASKLEGIIRHTSTHAAGIVISTIPLSSVTGVTINNSISVLQTSMDYIENIGLIKMDLLGLRNLSIMHNVISSIEKYEGIVVDIDKVDLNDTKVFELFSRGNSNGIFQFESEGMIKLLRNLKPDKFLDLAAANSLHRPGPMDNIDEFVLRKHGKGYDNILDDISHILDETYGIIVYQEQIMQIAAVVASFDYATSDILRRAMGKKDLEKLSSQKELFISNGIKNGYDKEVVVEIYDLILKFANYGFNKSHAVSYSYIGYVMAYLKVHFPLYFYTEILNNSISNSTKVLKYLNECRSNGIELVGININYSSDRFEIIDKKVVLPLTLIKGISSNSAKIIVDARKNGLFVDLRDFINRVNKLGISASQISALIYANAFFEIENVSKSTLINAINGIIDSEQFNSIFHEFKYNEYEEFTLQELIVKERELLGFNFSNHPTSRYIDNLDINTSNISNYINQYVNMILYVESIKEIVTKNSQKMAFITCSDLYGLVTCVIFPKVYENLSIIDNELILVNGKVEYRNDVVQIIVSNVKIRR